MKSRLAGHAAVALSPVIAFLVLRIRAMAPLGIADPALVSAYVVHPHDELMRFYAALEPSGRNRDGARIGFLLLARTAYVAFGAIGGFLTTRYLLALVAIVPTYVLLRRLYGRAAGAAGIVVILSSPVVLTAWGTDYSDSAVVSYMIAGLACLAMPSRHRRALWVAAASALFTLAVWSQPLSALLVGATAVSYIAVSWRSVSRAISDTVVAILVSAATTGILLPASAVLLGRSDFITPTLRSIHVLDEPSLVALYHSTSWSWAPYLDYLLVPPAVLGIWALATFGRRRRVPRAQLLVGIAGAAQLLVFAGLQFLGPVETLEYHYFSSQLWGSVCLVLAVGLSALAHPLLRRRRASAWLLPAMLLLVPLLYETHPHPPAFEWAPWGLCLGVLAVLFAVAARLGRRAGGPRFARSTAVVGCAGASLALLVLTTAPSPPHSVPAGTIPYPAPDYASALGGGWSAYADEYRVAASLPSFVGNATYVNEQLLMWLSPDAAQMTPDVLGPTGMYHDGYNSLPDPLPTLSAADRARIEQVRPAEILLMGHSGAGFSEAVSGLTAFNPVVLKSTLLRSGNYELHVTLVELRRYDLARVGSG